MKKYIYLIVLVASFVTCTDKFEEYNTDQKNPAFVPGEALFSNAQKALVDQVSSTNVNLNVWKLFSQYWTETTYVDEANYDIIQRNIPDFTFREYYRGFLRDFQEAKTLINKKATTSSLGEAEKKNKLAIIEIHTVYAYQQLVDIFGNIPYSAAENIENLSPVYDDAFTIYKDLISRLDAAISQLDESHGSFGSSDLIYGGDVSAWKKFGNSLKIKIGITIADADESLSKSLIEAAVEGAFSSADDNALFHYQTSTPNNNPLNADLVLSGRDDFVAANTIVDIMNDLDDPRRALYFTMTDTSSVAGVEKLAYLGGTYGESSPFAQYSHIAPAIQEASFPGILLTYDEILFYLAEAAERGFNVGSTAEGLYNKAITESFFFWGGTEDEAANYLAQSNVAYTTASGSWKQKIGTQAWIAFYTRGLEGYTEWRRLDYPILNIPPAIDNYSEIPVRFTYPVNEQTLNKDNYSQASGAIGGDELTTKLFWDKY